MFTIKKYNSGDFEMIKSWWDDKNEIAPTKDMLPETTFILNIGSTPSLCVSLYLTNSGHCYIENFAGNPLMKGSIRKEAGQFLFEGITGYAKSLGYNKVVCFAHVDKLKERYKQFGLVPTLDNIQSFVKEI